MLKFCMKTVYLILPILSLLFLHVCPVVADFDSGVVAYKNGKFSDALKEWTPIAERGIAEVQFNLGQLYRDGKGTDKNYEIAAKWYKRAANQGHSKAQYNLGIMYNNGYGVEKDQKKALDWYKLAALGGNSSAQYNLGLMYEKGRGTDRNYILAKKWYTRAAENGESTAQVVLGELYSKGIGLERNNKIAMKWFLKAASQENDIAQFNLGVLPPPALRRLTARTSNPRPHKSEQAAGPEMPSASLGAAGQAERGKRLPKHAGQLLPPHVGRDRRGGSRIERSAVAGQ